MSTTAAVPEGVTQGAGERRGRIARLTVNLPWKVFDALRDMAEADGVSKTEALRRAISTEFYLREARRDGAQVYLERPDGTVERIVFPY